jgi:CheY-like chemotaxis protein/anti-sigma regulatory factor (Ser/Thr protein kinase)
MAKVLVVDDSPVDRQLVTGLLTRRSGLNAGDKHTGLTAVGAADGKEALAAIEHDMPDLVLTDLQMPEMNGLELVEAVKAKHPSLPVILMTAHGSEDIAILALQRGAAGYVPKRNLARHLLETVETVLALATVERGEQRVRECLTECELNFALPNDPSLIMPLIGHLEDYLKALRLCNANGLLRVAVALREALLNAMEHGNLELATELRDKDEKEYRQLADERRQKEPHRSRRVLVQAMFAPRKAVYVVRDEGHGFDRAQLPHPSDPATLEHGGCRGLRLISTFMDEVTFNDSGNQITMARHRD